MRTSYRPGELGAPGQVKIPIAPVCSAVKKLVWGHGWSRGLEFASLQPDLFGEAGNFQLTRTPQRPKCIPVWRPR